MKKKNDSEHQHCQTVQFIYEFRYSAMFDIIVEMNS
jgi:hypothetical protein